MSRYPGIERAALLIALDNGGINRFRPQKQQAKELKWWLTKQPEEVLRSVDEWLSGLFDEQLNEVCCGGAGEP